MTEKDEDKILVKRIQGAPEKKVYYVNVGNMPKTMIQKVIDQFKKKEI